jgi:hypothetical protein
MENLTCRLNDLSVRVTFNMSEGYHPEVYDSPLYNEYDSAKFRSIIGNCTWIIALELFDIAYDTSAMSKYNMSSREGYL